MKLSDIDIAPFETLLLDRDGTINVHLIGDYVKNIEEFEFIPGVLDVMPKLAHHFKYIFVVTNQRGVGKGLLPETKLKDIHEYMIKEIEKIGGRIDGVYYCTSLTDTDIRRKPNRGMFDDILHDYPHVIPAKTLMIGDSDVDMEFARNCDVAFSRIDSLKKDGDMYKWIKA